MKRITAIVLMTALLLSGCGASGGETEALRRQYGLIDTAQMEAEVTFCRGEEAQVFTLRCDYTPQSATVTVIAPETVAGIRATVTGEEMTLTYDGECLSVGSLGGINPLSALPTMLHAIADGYLLEEGSEKLGELTCRRLLLDTTMGEETVQCAVWIDEETLLPRCGEFTAAGERVICVKMLAFSCTLREETTEE